MPFNLVVWDFDGTLADSLPAAVGIFNRLAPEMGFKPLEDLAAARGMSTRQLLRQQGISLWRLPRLVRKYHAAAAEEADKLKLATGLPAALSAIAESGVRLGVLSSNREDNIRRCLRANGAEGHFAFVIGYPRLFGKGKALKRILRAECLTRADVLYVGDELRDVEAAKKAGVKVAAVTWGFHTAELLRTAKPDYVVNDAQELVELIGRSVECGSRSVK
ncbi:MAG: HAD-IA family hydrolase [Planctomycetes bacterium]|nr:HAD-IA family hydrolase [Planctomycetota bacterium]